MAGAFGPNSALTWQPTKVEVARSGDLGYTTGTYESKFHDKEGKPQTRRGRYVTVWRKDPAGRWKVVIDIGNQDAP